MFYPECDLSAGPVLGGWVKLAVALQVRTGGKAHWMGDTVALAGDEDEFTPVVFVSQATGTDGDTTDQLGNEHLRPLFSPGTH